MPLKYVKYYLDTSKEVRVKKKYIISVFQKYTLL